MDARGLRPLGRTGLQVTHLGLGGVALGKMEIDDAGAVATIRAALAMGVRLLDTAPLYGRGVSERRFGRALAGVPRDRYVLATKVGRRLPVDLPASERAPGSEVENAPLFDYSHDGVLRTVEASLARLGLDRVDILHIHDPDEHEREAIDGAFRALQRLKEEGVCRAIGSGMNQAEMLARFARAADFDCFLLAGRYTLLDQIGLRELLPACLERGIGIIVGGPYNSGILAQGARPGATYNYVPATPEMLTKTARIEAICERYQVPLRAAALQFPLGHPAVVSVIPGALTVAEAEDNARMLGWPIPAELWSDLRAADLIDPDAPTPG